MKIKTNIKSGDLELVSGGAFLAQIDREVTISLESENEVPLNLVFRFKNDDSDNEKLNREAKVVNETTLDITFINYNNILGSFNKELWEIGSLAHRKLFMAYVIYGFNDSRLKKIDYSFYLGEEVKNG